MDIPDVPSTVEQQEIEQLRRLNRLPLSRRLVGFARLSGPGWIQGAITLGASTATTAFYLGWKFGYSMIWVNILGMAMGVIMFAALARPALSSRMPVYEAMKRYVSRPLALAWAVAAVVTSIFWAMNQYAAAAACLADLGEAFGWINSPSGLLRARWIVGLGILAVSIPLTWSYGNSESRGVRLYESVLKGIVGFMILCFGFVVFKTGIDWSSLLAGLIPSSWPESPGDRTMVLGALGCAVGINMTFLFPISLRARGWTKEHLGLARFDLVGGMLLPFALASSLVVIATANMLQGTPDPPEGPAEVARVMEPLFHGSWLPDVLGRVLFDLGIAAMPLSTIMILMLISGLALCELIGVSRSSIWFKIGSLLPALGVLGVAYRAPFWLGPLISSFALVLLPIAYLGFLLLFNSRSLLGEDLPRGGRRVAWNAAMLLVLAIASVGAGAKVYDIITGFF